MKRGKEKSGINFNISLSNRAVFTILGVLILVLGGLGVMAYTDINGVGHDSNQVGVDLDGDGTYETDLQTALDDGSFGGHSDGTNCPSGQYARGVDANGNAQGCSVDSAGSDYYGVDMKLTNSKHDGFFAGTNQFGQGKNDGYMKMNNWIQNKGCSGYHVCTSYDIARYMQTHSDFPMSQGSFAWYHSVVGGDSYSSTSSFITEDSCKGWSDDDSDKWGPVWSWTVEPSRSTCDNSHYVLCCK